jgi:hypothetical protein
VSLILEALKKLERDRRTQDRGFLVLAHPAAHAREGGRARAVLLVSVAAVAGAALAAVLLRGAAPPPPPSTPAAVAATPPTPAGTLAPSAAPVVPSPTPKPPGTRVTWRWNGSNAASNPNEQVVLPAAPRPPVTTGAGAAQPAAPQPPASAPAEKPAPDTASESADAADEAEVAPAAPAADAPLRLEAISERDGQPVAVVSGQVVRVGDRIGASTVVRIGAAEIELETEGLRRILRF